MLRIKLLRAFGHGAPVALMVVFALSPTARGGVTERASVDSAGLEADSQSVRASISASGRFLAFTSWATNLVAGDTNSTGDVFVHDRK